MFRVSTIEYLFRLKDELFYRGIKHKIFNIPMFKYLFTHGMNTKYIFVYNIGTTRFIGFIEGGLI